jgi:hypothetical protein
MFYNNLYNNCGFNRPSGNNNGNNGNNNNGNNNGNYTFLLQSKVDHTIQVKTNPYNITLSSTEVTSYSSITYVVEIPTIIFLPEMNEYINKVNLNIINKSGGLVTIKTQNGELMFNSSHLPPSGATTVNLTPNKFCKLILNKIENIYSYILLLA